MTRYLANRLLQVIPTVILVTILVFLMLYLTPGDPAEVFMGENPVHPNSWRIREDMG
jgi:peptide/nickel transport system permease protein